MALNLALELRCLPLSHRKGVSMPAVLTIPNTGRRYSGLYVLPRDGEYVNSERSVRARHGVLCVVEGADEASVTHEWRHHMQADARWPRRSSDWRVVRTWHEYWREARRYFRTYANEMDALLYERRYCPTELNESQLEVALSQQRTARQDLREEGPPKRAHLLIARPRSLCRILIVAGLTRPPSFIDALRSPPADGVYSKRGPPNTLARGPTERPFALPV